MNTPAPARHGHDSEFPAAHEGSLKSYLTGFVLAAILTVIPFWLVMDHVIDDRMALILVILVLAAVQILVHIFFFLHLSPRAEGGWNLLSLLFAAVLVVIVLGASIWSLYQENANMMPGMMHPQATQQTSRSGVTL
jgi:cytochrome o ubiquinol oxidase operon protein cyoD